MKYIQILEGIDPNWSIKEKVRYIYHKIAQSSFYDVRFTYSKDTELLYAIYNREIDIEEEEEPRIICRTANLVLNQLLSEIGIESKLIYKKSNIERPIEVDNVALIFWDEKGNKYYTNIVADIENCRYKIKTEGFGITINSYEEAQDVKGISQEELKEIDVKIGYIKSEYNNIVFQLLANEVKNTGNFKRFLKAQGINTDKLLRDEVLQYKLQYINKLIKFRDRTAGVDEQKRFYKILFASSVLDKFESQRFNTYEYIKEDKEQIRLLSVIEIKTSKMPVYYMYSEEEQTYIQLLPEEIKKRTEGYRERKGKRLLIQEESKEKEEDKMH